MKILSVLLLFATLYCCCHGEEFTSRREKDLLLKRGSMVGRAKVNGEASGGSGRDGDANSRSMGDTLDFMRNHLYIEDNEDARIDAINPATLTLDMKRQILTMALQWQQLGLGLINLDIYKSSASETHQDNCIDEVALVMKKSNKLAQLVGTEQPTEEDMMKKGYVKKIALYEGRGPDNIRSGATGKAAERGALLLRHRSLVIQLRNHYKHAEYLRTAGLLADSTAINALALELVPKHDKVAYATVLLSMANDLLSSSQESETEIALKYITEALELDPYLYTAYRPLVEIQLARKVMSPAEWRTGIVDKLEMVREDWLHYDQNEKGKGKPLKETKNTLQVALLDMENHMENTDIFWALYESAEAARDYKKAWKYLKEANEQEYRKREIENKGGEVDKVVDSIEEDNATAESVMGIFTDTFFDVPGVLSQSKKKPIFIIGIMRTGSTLLENILGAHSEIHTIGEHSAVNAALPEFRKDMVEISTGKSKNAGDTVQDVSNRWSNKLWKSMLQEHATTDDDYNGDNEDEDEANIGVDGMAQKKQSKNGMKMKSVIDKMLFNYNNLGFIHMLFPDAVIINMVRDPLDTLFSTYRKKFDDRGLSWTLLPDHIVNRCNIYLKLMNHWRGILPEGAIVDVRYEELVNDPKKVLKPIVEDKLNLEWDDELLNYHKNKDKKAVLTHSRLQLMGGIRNYSIATWKKYTDDVLETFGSGFKTKFLPKLIKNDALPYKELMNWQCDEHYKYEYNIGTGIDGSTETGN